MAFTPCTPETVRFSARLFRQGDAKQIEEARHEYLNASGFGCLAVLNDGYEGAGAQYRQ